MRTAALTNSAETNREDANSNTHVKTTPSAFNHVTEDFRKRRERTRVKRLEVEESTEIDATLREHQ